MKTLPLIVAFALAVASLALGAPVEIGMPESALLRMKGQPESKMLAGPKAVYRWPDLSVTMKDGKVESFKIIDPQEKRTNEAAKAKAEEAKKRNSPPGKKKVSTTSATPPTAGVDPEEKRLTDAIAKKARIVELENSIKSMESRLDANSRGSYSQKGRTTMSADEEALLRLRLEKARLALAELK